MKKIIIGLLAIFLSLVFLFIAYTIGWNAGLKQANPRYNPKTNKLYDLDPYKIFKFVNDYRVSKGLNPLVWDEKLCPFAKVRLSEIPSDWSHKKYHEEYKYYYNYSFTGENLAKDFNDEKDVVTSWIKSPEHNENLLDSHYNQTCIATNNAKDETSNNEVISFIVQTYTSNY